MKFLVIAATLLVSAFAQDCDLSTAVTCGESLVRLYI